MFLINYAANKRSSYQFTYNLLNIVFNQSNHSSNSYNQFPLDYKSYCYEISFSNQEIIRFQKVLKQINIFLNNSDKIVYLLFLILKTKRYNYIFIYHNVICIFINKLQHRNLEFHASCSHTANDHQTIKH